MTTTRDRSVVVVGRHDCSHFDAVRASCEKSGLETHAVPLGLDAASYSVTLDVDHADIAVESTSVTLSVATGSRLIFLPFAVNNPPWVEAATPFEVREWTAAMRSVFMAWGNSRAEGWLLDPQLLSLQDSKPFLLRQFAHHAPLVRVPPWAVSSAPAPLLTRIGPAVVKSVNAWQEIREGRYLNTAFVSEHLRSRVTTTELNAPLLVQSYVPHTTEVRLYVSGQRYVALTQIYPAEVHGAPDLRVMEPAEVDVARGHVSDHEVARSLRATMDQLDLRYCAFDYALEDGSCLLFDINPVGSWTFLEARHGLDLTEDIVEGVLA